MQKQEEPSLFLKALGNYPQLRVIDFLITFQLFDYPPTEIAKNAGVSFVTFQTFWPGMVERGFVKETRRVGNATMYKLNMENLVIKKLVELDNIICNKYCDKTCAEFKKKKRV